MTNPNCPQVSVIIPFFNRVGLIHHAIESVLNQTFEDFELVLVNDGSTDNLDSLKKYENESSVRIVHRDRQGGAGAARNTGVKAAKADTIAFLDSDDTWVPDKLEKQITALQRTSSSIRGVVCGFSILDDDVTRESMPFNHDQPLLRQLQWGCSLSPGSTLVVRRPVFDEVGFFDETMKRLEDWDWLVRYGEKFELTAVQELLVTVHRTSTPDPTETLRACDVMAFKHGAVFGMMGWADSLRFRSSLLVERSAVYFREKRYLTATWFSLGAIGLYPARNAAFYTGITTRLVQSVIHWPSSRQSASHADRRSMHYLSLEPKREGHASYTHVQEIVQNLENLGWDISLFNPEYQNKDLPAIGSRILQIFGTVARAIIAPRPHAYYMRWHFAAFPLALWAKIRRVPLTVEVNGPAEDLFIAWPWTTKFRSVFIYAMNAQLRWSSSIVAVTDGLATMVHEQIQHSGDVTVIPNGANTEIFCPDAKLDGCSTDRPTENPYLIFFGTMASWQGIGTILAAVKGKNWPQGLDVVFAGDGAEKAHVQETADTLPHVHFIGRVPYRQLPFYIANSIGSLVCTENLKERATTGLAPLKLFESMACGVPVITTDLPFQRDVVKGADAGLVIAPGDPDKLIEAVNLLIQDDSARLAMGQRGREHVVLEHSWRARAEMTHEVLKKSVKASL